MIKEKMLRVPNGNVAIIAHIFLFAVALFLFAMPGVEFIALFLSLAGVVAFRGYFSIPHGEAVVMVWLGQYKGTVTKTGFFWSNPLFRRQRVSTKLHNYSGKLLQLHDVQGTPIQIAIQASWQVKQAGVFYFEVESARAFFQYYADKSLRKVVSQYRMENTQGHHKGVSLLKNRALVEQKLMNELNQTLAAVGIAVLEVKINELSYAPEVAATFWQLKQVPLLLANKNALADGALKIAERTLQKIDDRNLAVMDEERRAAFVQSLVVAICSGQEDKFALTSFARKEL